MMTNEQARDFIKARMDAIVVNCDEETIKKIYKPDVVVHLDGLSFGLREIINRVQFNREVFSQRSYILREVIVAQDLLFFRVSQHLTHAKTQEVWQPDLLVVYRLEDESVAEVWFTSEHLINYVETPEQGLTRNISSSVLQSAKERFFERIIEYPFLIHGERQQVTLLDIEKEILFYTSKGFTAKQIAKKISLSHRTIEDYLNRLKEKFDCTDKAQLRAKLLCSTIALL